MSLLTQTTIASALRRLLFFSLSFLTCTAFSSAIAAPLSLVPQPESIKLSGGKSYELKKGAAIFYEVRNAPREIEKSLAPMAKVLAEEVEMVTGFQLKVAKKSSQSRPKPGDIILRFSKVKGKFADTEPEEDQNYQLKVSASGVIVESAYTKGVSYGTATLIQAMVVDKNRVMLPAMEIEDKPSADYRSVMLDIARKPHSIGVVKQVVQLARLYKLRYVHLHLTDNEHFTFPFEPVVSKIKNNHSYTREELVDLVAYADARGVTLIPELDLPGHSSRVRQSGYLDPGKNDADVADPANYQRITAIIDDMLGVFKSSPYFHIGGDESGAGSKLVPFLAAINKHLRGNPVGGKRRMIVWEGFHGAPTKDLPAKGEDRILVMAWESSYNAPWDLLNAGYEIVNSSWKPLYLAGGGGNTHIHNTGGRKFKMKDLFRWRKSIFMHWEPGRPIYEDRGPNDKDKTDGEWDARWIKKDDQVLGGQLQFWEQSQNAVMIRLPDRLAVVAARLWNPESGLTFEEFTARLAIARERVLTIVQPVQILPKGFSEAAPITDLYQPYKGDSLEVSFVNRTRLKGTIRYTQGKISGDSGLVKVSHGGVPGASAQAADGKVTISGGVSLCAKLFREDGTPVDGLTWKYYNNWPDKVNVTDYNVGRHTPKEGVDLASLPESKIMRRFKMPFVRGPLQHTEIKGQMLVSVFTAPETGDYVMGLKTQHGRGSLYMDLNQNGKWDKKELIIDHTPSSDKNFTAKVTLKKGKLYLFRIDHLTGMARPYIGASVVLPNTEKGVNINQFLSLPPES